MTTKYFSLLHKKDDRKSTIAILRSMPGTFGLGFFAGEDNASKYHVTQDSTGTVFINSGCPHGDYEAVPIDESQARQFAEGKLAFFTIQDLEERMRRAVSIGPAEDPGAVLGWY